MKKYMAIFLLCLLALLLIAARPRPRPCGTRIQCFNLLFPVATMTPTATMIPTIADVIQEDYRDMTSTPNYSIDWPPLPPPIPPSVYPPPVTAPPAGYP